MTENMTDSDSPGTSGTSTPSKEGGKDGASAKRNENYTSAALAEIRKSLQPLKRTTKDDSADDYDEEVSEWLASSHFELVRIISQRRSLWLASCLPNLWLVVFHFIPAWD